MASVTIVIPAYNSVPFLEETVACALAQSDPAERIVIVDDGSPDASFALAQRLAAAHPAVEAMQRPNGGAAAARNTGFRRATTDFVLFLDADDRLLPDAITLHLAAFARHPQAVMVFGSNHRIAADGAHIGVSLNSEQNVTRADLAMYVTPCPSQCLYRRTALEAVGGFNETLRPGDEIDLNIRLLDVGQVRSHPGFVMDYRHHPNQGIKNVYRNSSEHLRALALNIGPEGAHPDPVLYRRARRKWLARYGYRQHMAALGALRHGRWPQIWPATRLAALGAWARLMGAEWQPPRT